MHHLNFHFTNLTILYLYIYTMCLDPVRILLPSFPLPAQSSQCCPLECWQLLSAQLMQVPVAVGTHKSQGCVTSKRQFFSTLPSPVFYVPLLPPCSLSPRGSDSIQMSSSALWPVRSLHSLQPPKADTSMLRGQIDSTSIRSVKQQSWAFPMACLSSFPIAVIKHHDQGICRRESLFGACSSRGLEPVSIMAGSWELTSWDTAMRQTGSGHGAGLLNP